MNKGRPGHDFGVWSYVKEDQRHAGTEHLPGPSTRAPIITITPENLPHLYPSHSSFYGGPSGSNIQTTSTHCATIGGHLDSQSHPHHLDNNEEEEEEETEDVAIDTESYKEKESSEKAEPKHVILSLEQKRELIRMFEEEKVKARDLMDLFSIGKTQVYAILRQKNQIKAEYNGAKTDQEKQAKRKSRFTGNEEIDEIVHRWYVDSKSKNMFITGTQLKEHAKVVADALGKKGFKASNGWLECFRKRHSIVIPRSKNAKLENTSLSIPDGDFLSRTQLWTQELQSHIRDYSETNIFALDITTLYYQATPRCVKTSICDQVASPGPKLSILLCANACGEKEYPLIVGSAQMLPQFVNTMRLYFRRSHNTDSDVHGETIEEYIRCLNDRMRREQRSIVLFLLLQQHAHYILGKHFSNIKLVHWLPIIANTQPLQQGVFNRFKLNYRIFSMRNIISNGGSPSSLTLIDALQYISRSWHEFIFDATIRKAFRKAGFPVYIQNSFENPNASREPDIMEDLKDLERLINIFLGQMGHDVTKDFIEVEKSIDSYACSDYSQIGYGSTSAYNNVHSLNSTMEDFGPLFGLASVAEDSIPMNPPISSYHTALMELRRLQQFALKMNDYELQNLLFSARCAAEDRSASRIIAEKYLNMGQ